MRPQDLYLEAAKRGLRLESVGDKLAVFPKGRCPPDFADALRQHKTELLEWLSWARCPGWGALPPDNLPLAVQTPRPTPRDHQAVLAYLLRQDTHRITPLTAWLVKRENDYFGGPGSKWDCGSICYAAARDAACWQLNRTESEVWQFLETTAVAYERENP